MSSISTPAALSKEYISPPQAIVTAGAAVLPHGLGEMPKHVFCYLRCLTAEYGYAIGDDLVDIYSAWDASVAGTRGFSLVPDSVNLNIRFGNQAIVFTVVDKATGARVSLTSANWELRIRAWA